MTCAAARVRTSESLNLNVIDTVQQAFVHRPTNEQTLSWLIFAPLSNISEFRLKYALFPSRKQTRVNVIGRSDNALVIRITEVVFKIPEADKVTGR
jgi:hypothetical protein